MKKYLKWSFFSSLIGVLAGTAAAIFLISLEWVTRYRETHPGLIWILPVAGLFIGWMYHKYGRSIESGTGLILEEIHDPRNIIPLRMAPMILLSTVITHLFGGSAGREGTAVQMGSSLADQISRFFRLEDGERRTILIAGAGAGFSAAIGAPWAGALFGLEVIQIGRLRLHAIFECLVASFVAYFVCRALGAPHSVFPELTQISFAPVNFAWVLLTGAAFGLAANIFMRFTHFVESAQKRFVKNPMWRPFIAGLLLVVLYHLEGSYRYVGLGISSIQQSFQVSSSWLDPLFKTLFTGLTIGSGFKGGEFIPLVFVGSSLGSFMAGLLPLPVPLLSALGFAAVFGAAANTPIACAIMACEIFGWQLAPYAFLACWVSYFMTGHLGIYKNQKVVRSKKDQLLRVFRKPSSW